MHGANDDANLQSLIFTVTLIEEYMVYQNRVLGKIFGRKRDEVTGEWRRLHNEELHYKIKENDIAKHCTRLPDDGSSVIRNMLGALLNIL